VIRPGESTASAIWGGGSSLPPTDSVVAGGFDGTPSGSWCSGCGKYVPYGVLHHCAPQPTEVSSTTSWAWPVVDPYPQVIALLKEILETLQAEPEYTELAVEEVQVAASNRPLVLHFKGRGIPHDQVDGIRTQLDDWASGKDTRPLVINYDGEVKWVPDPEAA